jgi:hypothetical protein
MLRYRLLGRGERGTRKTVERALDSDREVHDFLPGSAGLKVG